MKPEFDLRKAAFLLVAAIIGVYMLVVLVSLGACIAAGLQGLTVNESCTDGKIGELLASALAAALALLVGSKE